MTQPNTPEISPAHSAARIAAVLPEDMLERFRDRAAGYDARNTFCAEDFDELVQGGYLKALIPEVQKGLGFTFPELVAAQRRLAAYAPATALAVNMHHVWAAVARSMQAAAAEGFEQVTEEIAAGEIYAFGISEPGNETVLFDSLTSAQTQWDGSVSYSGTKVFTTLSPVWTRLGIFGKDEAGGETPLVFGFLRRESPGWKSLDDWDVLGMRATQSRTTALDGAVVEASRVVRRLPTGPNQDPLVFSIFSSFLTLIAAVYTGIGDRAVELAAAHIGARRSAMTGELQAEDPVVRYKLAEARMQQLSLDAHIRQLSEDVEQRAEHGAQWFPRLVTLRTQATRTARWMVSSALELSGGAHYRRESELSRLLRDVTAGIHHPSNDDSAHRTIANALLG